jgi:hypothetical protein
MSDQFRNYSSGLESPALGAFAVTPSDTVDLTTPVRAVTIGGEGTVSFIAPNGTTYTTGVLPVGTYALRASRIRATGTTATVITGWV